MSDTHLCCARCGFRVDPVRAVRVLDELGSTVRCEYHAVELLQVPGITIVIPRPAEVPA